nr:ARID DNA-binding domain-containing protein [Tanacetum cinerariifolium]
MRPLPESLPPIIKGVSIHLFDLYELIESMGGYISVQFEGDFEGLAEILGSDGMDIRRCYLDYLEPLVLTYKAARSSNPTGGYGDECIRRFDGYYGDGNKNGSTAAKEKEIVKHFGITLKEEGKYDAAAHQDEIDMARIKCYLCQRTGHFDFKCPNEDQRPTNGASTSRQQGEEDTHSSSGDDFIIIDNPDIIESYEDLLVFYYPLQHIELALNVCHALVTDQLMWQQQKRMQDRCYLTEASENATKEYQELLVDIYFSYITMDPLDWGRNQRPDFVTALCERCLTKLCVCHALVTDQLMWQQQKRMQDRFWALIPMFYNGFGGKLFPPILLHSMRIQMLCKGVFGFAVKIHDTHILIKHHNHSVYSVIENTEFKPEPVKGVLHRIRMREQHNNYLEDYFDALDRSANIERRIEQPYEKENDDVEIGYISVQFEDDFEGLAEVLGLERSDAFEIQRCYLDYLEPLVSNYKAARSSNPTGGYEDEGIRHFEDYRRDGNMDGSTAAKEKGRVKHFEITLEKEEEGKYDATAHQDMARIKCYLCQKTGHFNGECPNEDQRPTNGASTSGPIKEEDTQSISSGDFTIIT